MSAVIAWFMGTKVGRYAAGGLAIAAVVIAAIFKVLAMGRAEERARQQAESLKAIKQRKASDDEVDRLDPARVNDDLSRWMRDK